MGEVIPIHQITHKMYNNTGCMWGGSMLTRRACRDIWREMSSSLPTVLMSRHSTAVSTAVTVVVLNSTMDQRDSESICDGVSYIFVRNLAFLALTPICCSRCFYTLNVLFNEWELIHLSQPLHPYLLTSMTDMVYFHVRYVCHTT